MCFAIPFVRFVVAFGWLGTDVFDWLYFGGFLMGFCFGLLVFVICDLWICLLTFRVSGGYLDTCGVVSFVYYFGYYRWLGFCFLDLWVGLLVVVGCLSGFVCWVLCCVFRGLVGV